jgi:hypothetical protein
MITVKPSAKLFWDANTEPDLAGYRVYVGTVSGQYALPIDVGKVTSVPLAGVGMIADGAYVVALTAYDLAGNASGFSVELPFALDGTPPASPLNLRVQ